MAVINPEVVPSNVKLNVTNVKSIFNGGGRGSAITRRRSSALIPKSGAIVPSRSDARIVPTGGDIVPKGDSVDSGKVFDLNNYDPLEKRVSANEKKITMLKRIVKTHQNPFGGDPLMEITSILQDIGNALALDFSNRITERNDEISDLRESAESKKRGGIESGLETVNKISNKVNNAFGAVLTPAKNILDKIIGFFGNLAAGFLADKAMTWLSNNQEVVTGFFKFLQDHGKKILIGLGVLIGGVIGVKLVRKIIGVVKFIGGVIKRIKGAVKLAQSIFKYKNVGKIAKRAATALLGKKGMKAVKGVGKFITGGGKNIGKGVKTAAKGAKALVKGGGKGLLKGLGKFGGKSFLKKIPIVGLGLGAAFAAGKLLQKPPDWLGAAMELGSGAASMIPGVGTAVSLALDAGTMYRDSKRSQESSDISAVEQDYKNVVKTATNMNFSGNVESSNLQLSARSGVTVMDTIKVSDMVNNQNTADMGSTTGDEESLPIIGSEDRSNSYIALTKDLLGVYD